MSVEKERERLIGKIPPQFAWSNLETLTPQSEKHDKQARLLKSFATNRPHRSFRRTAGNG